MNWILIAWLGSKSEDDESRNGFSTNESMKGHVGQEEDYNILQEKISRGSQFCKVVTATLGEDVLD